MAEPRQWRSLSATQNFSRQQLKASALKADKTSFDLVDLILPSHATDSRLKVKDTPEILQRTTTAQGPVKHQKTTSNEAVKRITAYLSEKGSTAPF
jgi:hypothetical protein